MLKTNHLQLPSDKWRHLHNLRVSLDNARTSAFDAFGCDVSTEIISIIENTEKRIQRILDKNFAVHPRDFDKYKILQYKNRLRDDSFSATIKEAKAIAKTSMRHGCERVEVYSNHSLILVFDEQSKNGREPLYEDNY